VEIDKTTFVIIILKRLVEYFYKPFYVKPIPFLTPNVVNLPADAGRQVHSLPLKGK